jgi:hypothetical protein
MNKCNECQFEEGHSYECSQHKTLTLDILGENFVTKLSQEPPIHIRGYTRGVDVGEYQRVKVEKSVRNPKYEYKWYRFWDTEPKYIQKQYHMRVDEDWYVVLVPSE